MSWQFAQLAQESILRWRFGSVSIRTWTIKGTNSLSEQLYRLDFVLFTWLALLLAVSTPSKAQQKEKPNDVQHSLELAAVLLNSGDAPKAWEVLDDVETAEPENPWLWYFRGIANTQLGRAYPALACLDRSLELLSSTNPPDELLSSLVRAQRQSVRREVFNISLRLGSTYDTNVTFLGGNAIAEGLIANEKDGAFGSEFSVFFAPLQDESQMLTLGFQAANLWQFRVDAFDVQDYTAMVRYAHRLTPRSTLSFEAEENVIYLGNDPYLFKPTGTVEWKYSWPSSSSVVHLIESSAFYRIESRDFRYQVERDFDRDGVSHMVGVAQEVRFRPIPAFDWYWDAQLGYHFEDVRTQGTEFDRRVQVASAGVAMPLVRPKDTTKYLLSPDKPLWLAFRADWEVSRYRNDSLNDRHDRKRVDRIGTYRLMLSQLLRKDVDRGDVTLSTVLQWSDANSNLRTTSDTNPFTFDKFVFGLQIEWSW